MTSASDISAGQDPEHVEEQLKKVCERLRVTEVNIGMFSRMVRTDVATNDVRNFVLKQSNMKKASDKFDLKLCKSIMKRKLNDACALASRLRNSKNKLKAILSDKFKYSNSTSKYSNSTTSNIPTQLVQIFQLN